MNEHITQNLNDATESDFLMSLIDQGIVDLPALHDTAVPEIATVK
jgi:hypothetical protein